MGKEGKHSLGIVDKIIAKEKVSAHIMVYAKLRFCHAKGWTEKPLKNQPNK